MSSVEVENSDEPDFSWGKKRGVGGKKKEVQFYESFTYDGVEYALYDCVYMFNKEIEEYPHIGKLIKIWENANKSKRIKVQWFFRPSEISNWLKTFNLEALENELFFATGEGLGLANVNPLEAIVGKCFVVCISRDSRNPQPSAQHFQMADYVFYRTFDVGQCTISDKMDDRVGGLEVRYLFNKQENEMITGPNIGSKPKEEDRGITVVFEETLQLSGEKKLMKSNEEPNDLVAKVGMEANFLPVKDEPSHGIEKEQVEDSTVSSNQAKVEDSSVPANDVKVQEISECDPHNLDGRPFEKVKPHKNAIGIKGKVLLKGEHSTFSQEDLEISTVDSIKEKRKSDTEKDVAGMKDTKFDKDSSSLDDRPLKIPKVEDSVKLSEIRKKNHLEESINNAKAIMGKAVIKGKHSTSFPGDLQISTVDSFKENRISDIGKDLTQVKDTKFDKVRSLDDRPSKKQKVEYLEKLSKVEKKENVEKPSDGGEVKGCLVVGSTVDNEREVMLAQNSPSLDDLTSKDKSTSKIIKFTKPLTGLENISNKEILEQNVILHKNVSELTKDSSKLSKGPSLNMSKHTFTKLDKDLSNEMYDGKIRKHGKDLFGLGKGPSKEKFDAKSSMSMDSSLVVDNGTSFGADKSGKGQFKEKLIGKTSVPMRSSFVVDGGPSFGIDRFDLGPSKEKLIGKRNEPLKSFVALDKGLSKAKLDKMSSMLPDYNSSEILEASLDAGKIHEVTQKPNSDKGKWYTSSPWENMKVAHDERRIILLQNLDPGYTSGEVEDILWSAFKETCTVKMVQCAAFSSPHYGQALVILKTREAAERVVGKLNDGCLLTSNQRPLVGSIANLPQSLGKQCNFIGHLCIDKIKLQMQREKRDALSTAHYSQSNTIEYELAMEWCLLQSRYDLAWESLHKRQGAEFSKCMANFKSNSSRNNI